VNEQLVDIMNDNKKYVVKNHTREYNGMFNGMFSSGTGFFANLLLLPIQLPLATLHLIGFPVNYKYGMTLDEGNSNDVFVAYSSLKETHLDKEDDDEEYNEKNEKEKKYQLVTQAEFTRYQEAKQKRETEKLIQQQESQRKEAEEKAAEERRQKQLESCLERNNVCCRARVFYAGAYFNNEIQLSNGDCFRKKGCRLPFLRGTVSDIASKGVLIGNNHMFIYTNKQYVNGQRVDPEHYYEYAGTYEYRTTTGGTNRVDAFKETNIPLCGE